MGQASQIMPLYNFYPRPLRGGRRRLPNALPDCLHISIHALCEEGDCSVSGPAKQAKNFYPRPLRGGRHAQKAQKLPKCKHFYPRPLRGGRRPHLPRGRHEGAISIHALCEEGDGRTSGSLWAASDFYPRPLRGGRLESIKTRVRMISFLSTPSARRATAKTETKSLFSNKLYNILHEFRRALIYNGSKNDPNHAK